MDSKQENKIENFKIDENSSLVSAIDKHDNFKETDESKSDISLKEPSPDLSNPTEGAVKNSFEGAPLHSDNSENTAFNTDGNEYIMLLDSISQQATDINTEEAAEEAFVQPLINTIVNVDDSQELADEVGISNVFDKYNREILEPVFENLLRQSKNSVKLSYSKIKNTLLSYKDIKQSFLGDTESFLFGKEILFSLKIGENCLYLYNGSEIAATDKKADTDLSQLAQNTDADAVSKLTQNADADAVTKLAQNADANAVTKLAQNADADAVSQLAQNADASTVLQEATKTENSDTSGNESNNSVAISEGLYSVKSNKVKVDGSYEKLESGEEINDKIENSLNAVTDKNNYDISSSTVIKIQKETEKKDKSSLLTALDFIEQTAKNRDLKKKKTYIPTAYAERYPHNPQAVIKGKEEIPPKDNEFDDTEYDFIEGELTKDIIKELMGDDFNVDEKQGRDKLDALRQQASTIKGAIAIAEPVVYFYDCALNNDNSIAYINVQQVLNDKFMGKILPNQYFAVAESSERINTLNLMAVEQLVKDCNENPDLLFVTKISCRLFAKSEIFEKLLKTVKTEKDNLILAINCSFLELLGEKGLNAVNSLKQQGVKIMIDDTENASLKVLTEYPIDYLRFDARYYTDTKPSTLAHLDMLTGYAKVQGIIAASQNVIITKEVETLQKHGVTVIQGFAVNKPQRLLLGAKKRIKVMKPFK